MLLFEQQLSRATVFNGKVFDVHVDKVRLENNAEVNRELVEHHGGVAVLAIDDDDNLLMVRQFRYGAQQTLLELPAGKLEQGEDPADCGLRELMEETGMAAGEYRFFAKMYPTPAYCSECIHIYLAAALTPGKQKLDDDEFLNVERVPFTKVLEMCENGEITDAKTLIGVLKYAAERRKQD